MAGGDERVVGGLDGRARRQDPGEHQPAPERLAEPALVVVAGLDADRRRVEPDEQQAVAERWQVGQRVDRAAVDEGRREAARVGSVGERGELVGGHGAAAWSAATCVAAGRAPGGQTGPSGLAGSSGGSARRRPVPGSRPGPCSPRLRFLDPAPERLAELGQGLRAVPQEHEHEDDDQDDEQVRHARHGTRWVRRGEGAAGPRGRVSWTAMLLVFGPRSVDYDFGPGHPLTPRRFGPGIDLLRAVGAEPGLAPEPAAGRGAAAVPHAALPGGRQALLGRPVRVPGGRASARAATARRSPACTRRRRPWPAGRCGRSRRSCAATSSTPSTRAAGSITRCPSGRPASASTTTRPSPSPGRGGTGCGCCTSTSTCITATASRRSTGTIRAS